MRYLITGHKGQLGRALLRRLPEAVGIDLPEVDICDSLALGRVMAAERPDLILHCAAMTDVDGAARDPALAYHINGLGTQNLALAAARAGAALVYLSTNEVLTAPAVSLILSSTPRIRSMPMPAPNWLASGSSRTC